MKQIIFLLALSALGATTTHAQAHHVKKGTGHGTAKHVAKAPVAPVPPPEPQSPLNVETAGRYAKDLANRMYNTDCCYGDKHTGFSLSIINWKSIQGDDGTYYYLIQAAMSWKEGTGGFGDWKPVSYKGVIMCDQFGCNPFYFISEKQEAGIFGILKRARQLEEPTLTKARNIDDWMQSIQYGWGPDGCLN